MARVMTDYVQVFTAVDSREKAEEIARKVVELRLAACAQVVGPVRSTYWWRGKAGIIWRGLMRNSGKGVKGSLWCLQLP